jgi:hypothetical protein
MVGTDQLDVEAEMRLHLIDRELRRGDRRRPCIVAVGTGQIGQHAQPDQWPGLGAGSEDGDTADGSGAGENGTAGEWHGRITPTIVASSVRRRPIVHRAPPRHVNGAGRHSSSQPALAWPPPAQSCRRSVSVRFTRAASSACCRVPVLAKTCWSWLRAVLKATPVAWAAACRPFPCATAIATCASR